MEIGFTKMHGLGNDFIVMDNFNGRIKLSKEQIIFLCDRHKGIGADGLILVESALSLGEGKGGADCFMDYYNADGSQAEMCGNGVRCVARFLKDFYLKDKENFKIGTRAGTKEIELKKDGTFSVNMGQPVFSHEDFPEKPLKIQGLLLNFVSMGNPHAVAFVDDLNLFDISKLGAIIESHSAFPNKINLEIVENTQDSPVYNVKVWERGCGETLACGTGACAVYALARKNGNMGKEIIINLPGGKLFLSENDEGEILMRGLVANVYSGMIYV